MKRYSEKSFAPNADDMNHAAYKEGCAFYKRGNFTKAAHAFKESLEFWPTDPQAWFALGNCYDELGKPGRAEKCFRKSLEYSSADKVADTLFNLGNSLFDQNKFSEAIECYENISAQSAVYRVAQRNISVAKKQLSGENT